MSFDSLRELNMTVVRALGLVGQQITSIDLHFSAQEIPTAVVGMLVFDDADGLAEMFETYDLHPTKREVVDEAEVTM